MSPAPERDPNQNEWKSRCWSTGYLVAPEVRPIDVLTFENVTRLVYQKKDPSQYQLCFGIPIEPNQGGEPYALSTLQIRDALYELHPVTLGEDESVGHVVGQIGEPGTIPLHDWLQWHIEDARPVFLLRQQEIDMNTYAEVIRQSGYPTGSFAQYLEINYTPVIESPIPHGDQPIRERKPRVERGPRQPKENLFAMFQPEFVSGIAGLDWEEFRTLARLAEVWDSKASITFESQTKNRNQLGREQGISAHTVKKFIQQTIAQINGYLIKANLAPEDIYALIEEYRDRALPIPEYQTYVKRERGFVPDPVRLLSEQPWDVQLAYLHQIPITHKFALIERYNLQRQAGPELMQVSYDTILATYPEFKRRNFVMMVSTAVKNLEKVMNGQPLDNPPQTNTMYEIGNGIRADELTEDDFRQLCLDAGIQNDDLTNIYIYGEIASVQIIRIREPMIRPRKISA